MWVEISFHDGIEVGLDFYALFSLGILYFDVGSNSVFFFLMGGSNFVGVTRFEYLILYIPKEKRGIE